MFKKKDYYLFLFITILALVVRYVGRDYISDDMSSAFIPWFRTMKEGGGLSSLGRQVGDYGLIYQTIVALLTYIDANPVYLYKSVSVLFDFLLAFSIAYFVRDYGSETIFKDKGKDEVFILIYAYVLMLPTVVTNSAFWGQCDSIYTFFLLWTVWFLFKEEYHLSFFMLGWALAFKLQSVLLFPLFVYYFFSRKKYSLFNFIITACTFWLSGIVVYVHRFEFFDNVGIYSNQVVMFKRMWMNVPSFWVLVGDDYNKLHIFAIGLTFFILGIAFLKAINGQLRMDSFEEIVALAVFIEWTCILFLPAMHERYTYVMDLFLLMLALINKQYIKYAFLAISISCLTYNAYLFSGKEVINPGLVIVYLCTWLHYSYTILKNNSKIL